MAKIKAAASADEEMKHGVKFKSATIKNDLFLSVKYDEELPGHSKNKLSNDCTVPVHEDLKVTFQKLHRHLALLCSLRDLPQKKQFYKTDFEEFTVSGFSVGGNDDSSGVTVNGSMEGAYGTVNLSTPFTKYVGDDYPFLSELGQDILACEFEIDQYLFKGKRAPEVQLEMELPEAPGSDTYSEEGK